MTEGENETSKKILAAAYKCMTTGGYANVSMRDIAEEAGVALSQINYYYKNKDGLLSELINSVKQAYLLNVENNLKKSETTQEKVSSLVKYTHTLIKENIDLYKVLFDFFSMAMWSKSVNEQLRAFYLEMSELIERYISRDYSINEKLQIFTPHVITRMIIGAIFGIALQYIIEPENEELLKGINIIQAVIE